MHSEVRWLPASVVIRRGAYFAAYEVLLYVEFKNNP